MKIKRISAVTLLETLAVVAIITLLAALLYPVLVGAKAQAKQTSCLTQLRQAGMAMLMYKDNSEGWPTSLDHLVDRERLDERLLLCPDDPFGGYATKFQECKRKKHAHPQSYESISGWPSWRLEQLEAADSNHGIIACRLHGDRNPDFPAAESNFCTDAEFMFKGTLNRFRKDGSVQTAKLRFGPPLTPDQMYTVSDWNLFTDERDKLVYPSK